VSWPMVKLGDCCEVVSGGTPKREIGEYWDGSIYWVTPKDLSQLSSIYIDSTPERITDLGLKKSSATLLPKHSLLFSSRAPIGHLAITTTEMATNQGFKSLIPKSQADVKYLFFCLKYFRAELENLGNGATFKEVSKKVVENYQIPLPPLPIQKQIAAVLEKADTLRQQCQQMEQELNALAQSVFLEMFGDPVRNPKSWQKKSLSTVTDRIIDCPHTTPQWTADGITCLRTTNLTYGGWNFADHRFVDAEQYKERTSRSEIEPGDIILSREGTVGVAAIVDVGMKLCLGQRLVQVRPNVIKIHSEFLLYQLLFLLTPERLTQVMSGSTVKHLNMSDIRSLGVIVPPIEDQIQFKQVWTSIKSELIKTERQISSLDECFYSLMQRAFKGELDLTTNA